MNKKLKLNDVTFVFAKNREDWLKLRDNGIGGSAIGTILGVNHWDTPARLWARKAGLTPPPAENVAMRMGHRLEPIVTDLFVEQTGAKIYKKTEADFICVRDGFPLAIGSPDRIGEIEGVPFVLECKTTARDIDPDDIPKSWFAQVQWYLGITGIEVGFIAWLTNGRDFDFKEVRRIPDFFEACYKRAEEFWECVQNNTPPKPLDSEDVAVCFAKLDEETPAEIDEEGHLQAVELAQISEQISALSARADVLKEALKVKMADKTTATWGGKLIATWKQQKDRTKFDQKRFEGDHPELAKEYITTTAGARVFLLKPKNL